jgi:predicted O-methyltransferase YrrM
MPSAKLEQMRNRFINSFKRISMNTTSGDATFIRILIESSKAKRGLEIGTATGWGAIQMGLGFERNGGKLISIDPNHQMVEIARDNIKKVKLHETVGIIEGDALTIVPTLKGRFDFVFIDAIKGDYLKYLRAIEPKLKTGSVIVADNVIQFKKQMKDYLNIVLHGPNYRTVIIRASEEKNDGMTVSYKLQ